MILMGPRLASSVWDRERQTGWHWQTSNLPLAFQTPQYECLISISAGTPCVNCCCVGVSKLHFNSSLSVPQLQSGVEKC